jgi:hypothetical protein
VSFRSLYSNPAAPKTGPPPAAFTWKARDLTLNATPAPSCAGASARDAPPIHNCAEAGIGIAKAQKASEIVRRTMAANRPTAFCATCAAESSVIPTEFAQLVSEASRHLRASFHSDPDRRAYCGRPRVPRPPRAAFEARARVGRASQDIEVTPTIDGIQSGRDELLDAAIAYRSKRGNGADRAPSTPRRRRPLVFGRGGRPTRRARHRAMRRVWRAPPAASASRCPQCRQRP